MLNRIANVCTFFTLGLLTTILWLGIVAIHDFNNPDLPTGNSKIFIREYERHADYEVGQIEGRLVGFRIDYTVCGRPDGNYETLAFGNGNGKVLKAAQPAFGYVSHPTLFPGASYEPMPEVEVKRLHLSQGIARNMFELGRATRRVCHIDFSGVGAASLNFVRALI